ncbi:hypothetical protein [Mesorhizobium sp. M3A.F.Ca.ET.174.01.1.1]|uniref:hypothetical protein n=1 Tax=Mesorhizobium sp. M3A.F.Ca.ET.174.01.1.1 TaxID=2563944 RepID=UPI0010938375|nr:hypothetical protein [Mesorhizobium sp. M3A.F.Ca.ET.174.01.1.1]
MPADIPQLLAGAVPLLYPVSIDWADMPTEDAAAAQDVGFRDVTEADGIVSLARHGVEKRIHRSDFVPTASAVKQSRKIFPT